MYIMNRIPIFVIAVFVICSAGCHYDPGPPAGPGKTTPAKTGSTYTYKNTPIDTTGKLLTDSSYTTIVTVAITDTTYNGKTHVTRFSTQNMKTGLITNSFINYEDNGDISEYSGGSFLTVLGIKYPDWVTYPAQSHTSIGFKVYDDTVKILPVPIYLVVMDSITYVNWNSFPINNSSIPVLNLKQDRNYKGEVIIIAGFPGIPIGTNEVTTISFAPSIGYYADRTSQPTKVPQGLFPSFQGSEMTLVSYTLLK